MEGQSVEERPVEMGVEEMEEMSSPGGMREKALSIYIPWSKKYVKVGGTVSIKMKISNNADTTQKFDIVPVSYEVQRYERTQIDPEWVSVSPSSVSLSPGESEVVEIRVSIPENVAEGYYSGTIAVRSSSYPEQLRYYSVYVYRPLEKEIVRTFEVGNGVERMLVIVEWDEYDEANENTEITLESPSGVVGGGEVKSVVAGWVGPDDYYFNDNSQIRHTYKNLINSPESGEWSIKVRCDVPSFNFRVIMNPSDEDISSW
ncbi:hypothetical protein DRN72_03255 [Methanosarcinales archaeon]|nr:MAG: hypothetical protein DRN72_03255 [Methanosarcinales archaeon]